MKKILLSLMAVLMPLLANADTQEIGGIYYNLVSKAKQAAVTSNPDQYTGEVNIPSTVVANDGITYAVTSIRENAFSYCSGLTSVTIPNSVTSIGEMAFLYCTSLTSITIPNSVTSIGYGAFQGCSTLTSVTIPNNVTTIEGCAFALCTSLTSVTIPNSVTYIDSSAFSDCSGLTSITIPNSVTYIGGTAFSGCSGLTSITIPNSVTRIDNGAFQNCEKLTSVTIGSGVRMINDDAFSQCEKLEDVYCYVEELFSTDPLYTSTNAFDGSYIEYVTLHVPSSLVSAYSSIEPWSHFGTIVALPSPNIVFADGNVKTLCVANWDTGGDGELSLAEAAAVTDLGTVFWNNTSITSFDELQYFTGLSTIYSGYPAYSSSGAFYGCSNLTSVIIPDNVTSIGIGAFEECSSLASVTIPNSVTSIGDGAFKGCTSLTSVTIPNSVTSIGMMLFYQCSNLTSFTIPDNVTSIGDEAFSDCSSLTSVTIPNNVTSIGAKAFWDCSGLTSITIPSSVTSIGDLAFGYCTNLTSVTVEIANPITLITANTFSNRANATLYVPAGSVAAYTAADYWKEFKEIKEIPVTVSITLAKAQTTYCYDQPLNFTGVSGIRAYVASGFNPTTGALLLMHVDEVPANTGLLLKGTAGQTYEIPVEGTDFYYLNMFKGVLSGVTLPKTSDGYNNYFLKDGLFCLSDGTATIGANKAYLRLPVSTASARAVIYYETDDGYTGVMDVMEDRHESEDVYYNLNGQRVDNPKKGLYIQNGKKVVIK